MKAVGKTLDFEGEPVILGEKINGDLKQIWMKVKTCLKKGVKERRREVYYQKEMQSTIKEQNQQCNLGLKQNLTPAKAASIMSMLEQMVETRLWKVTRGLIEYGKCSHYADNKRRWLNTC